MGIDGKRPEGPPAPPSPAVGPTLEGRLRQLNSRLKARGLPLATRPASGSALAPQLCDPARGRLSAFSSRQIESVQDRIGPVYHRPWPKLDGCLGLLFTSRSGSTYLARELANRYQIGVMGESLNPHMVQGIAAADIVRAYAGRWFGFKLGEGGIISAEICGVISQYLDRLFFILLVRRDIVGQAVSLVKADQTGQWLSIHSSVGEPWYDGDKIGHSIRVIAKAVASIRNYVELTGRPSHTLFYEDFENGDIAIAENICDEFAIPRLAPGQGPGFTPLTRTADTVNRDWIERFQDEMDGGTRDAIDEYLARL